MNKKDRLFVIISVSAKIKQKEIYPMESITQVLNFKKNIELISLNMFKIELELNVLSFT